MKKKDEAAERKKLKTSGKCTFNSESHLVAEVEKVEKKPKKQKKEKVPKIYFGTRTHTQVKQLVKELRATDYR